MSLLALFSNQPLIAALVAWIIAQTLKVPLHYRRTKHLDWSLLFRAGGMPSSHSALIAGLTHALGLYQGFNSPAFAISFCLAMIVIYDATGIRRQSGKHAKIINQMIMDLASGHPLKEEQLKEVLGHSPLEAFAGVVLGICIAQIVWFVWH